MELLTNHYIEYSSTKLGRDTLKVDKLEEILSKYKWPGNARELENVMERAVILADTAIREGHLGIQLNFDLESLNDAKLSLSKIAEHAAQKAEVEVINRILEDTNGNKSQAAKILGVSYKTLLSKSKSINLGRSRRATRGRGYNPAARCTQDCL